MWLTAAGLVPADVWIVVSQKPELTWVRLPLKGLLPAVPCTVSCSAVTHSPACARRLQARAPAAVPRDSGEVADGADRLEGTARSRAGRLRAGAVVAGFLAVAAVCVVIRLSLPTDGTETRGENLRSDGEQVNVVGRHPALRDGDVVLAIQGRPLVERVPPDADRLYLSPKTIRNHASNIFMKLQVADRAEAIVRARRAGLGDPPPAR